MFEKEHESSREKQLERGDQLRTIFEEHEHALAEQAGGSIDRIDIGKIKEKAARLLAAFSIVMGASSAFAQETQHEKIETSSPAEIVKVEEKVHEKNKTAPFDWQSLTQKIELSMGGTTENAKFYPPEVISDLTYEALSRSTIYRGMPFEKFADAHVFWSDIFRGTQNVEQFFSQLSANKDNLSEQQKIALLQNTGSGLNATYNWDMMNANQHVVIDDNTMYNAAKDLYTKGKITQTGICGNIHTFLTKQAQAMGFESWLQEGELEKAGHIWTGLITQAGGKKQISFLNYGELLPTGTLNYKDALGAWERYQKSISTFRSFVGNEKEVLFPVKSRAQEVVEVAAGVGGNAERLEHGLVGGKVEKKDTGISLNVSPEITSIKLNADHFGLAFTHFIDLPNNPYQSLETMSALGGNVHYSGEHLGVEAGATVVHLNTKDLHGGSAASNELIARITADFINQKQLSKGELGEFLYDCGATFEGAFRMQLHNKDLRLTSENLPSLPGSKKGLSIPSPTSSLDSYSSAEKGEIAIGNRLVYIDPNQVGKFYIGTSHEFQGIVNDFQNQKGVIKKVAQNFVVGGEFKVHEAQVVNLEAKKGKLDWGNSFSVKGGISGEKLKGEMLYQKNDSAYERYIPSSTKLEAKVGYQVGPKFRVDVIGAKNVEQYKDDAKRNTYNVGVKFTIFVW